jgi:hypothetical protein
MMEKATVQGTAADPGQLKTAACARRRNASNVVP